MIDELVALLNEMLPASEERRQMVQKAICEGHVTLTETEKGALAEDVLIQPHGKGEPIRISVLGMLNTALTRAGHEKRLVVAVCDEDDRLLRFELRPYPKKRDPPSIPSPSPSPSSSGWSLQVRLHEPDGALVDQIIEFAQNEGVTGIRRRRDQAGFSGHVGVIEEGHRVAAEIKDRFGEAVKHTVAMPYPTPA